MSWKHDKTLIIINFWLAVFTVVTIFVVFIKPSDGMLYTLFSGAFGNVLGALMMLLKLDKPQPPPSITNVPHTEGD